jgi:ubiquinone biosynthesis protein UbiJ
MNMLFLPALSKAVNTALALDPESDQRLKKLQGKVITIEFLPVHFTFQCVFTSAGIEIQKEQQLASEAVIRGTPLQMLGAMLSKDNRQRFFAEDLIIEGNAELAQQVVNLFDEMEIDWEEQISRVVGDVPAYHAGRLLRGAKQWLRKATDSLSENVNEYVHEEARWVPAREALQDYFNDIDALRMDVDRAEARLQNLLAALNEKESQ